MHGKMPLMVAAEAFMHFKYGSIQDPPDTTGQMEGVFAAPLEEVVHAIAACATSKIQNALLYRTFSETLRDPTNTALGEHFKEHAEDELEAADFFNRRAAVLMGDVHLGNVETPPPATDLHVILNYLIRAEQESLMCMRNLHKMLGDNPMKYEVEQFLSKGQHHIDDLWQHIPHVADPLKTAAQLFKVGGDIETAKTQRQQLGVANDSVRLVKSLRGEAEAHLVPSHRLVTTPIGALIGALAAPKKSSKLVRAGYTAAGGTVGALAGTELGKLKASESVHKAIRAAQHTSKPDVPKQVNPEVKLPDNGTKQASVVVGVDVEQYDNRVFDMHGPIMKAALAATRPTVFVPKFAEEKTVKVASQIVKAAQVVEYVKGLRKRADEIPLDVPTLAYLQQKQVEEVATSQNEAAFYRQQSEQAQQQAQAAQQQAQAAQQQIQELSQQVQEGQEQAQGALQQAQQTRQLALSTALQSQAAAAAAMQQSLAKGNELLQQQQVSHGVREFAQQQQRSLLSLAQQPLPPATTFEMGSQGVGGPNPGAGVPGQMGVESNPQQGGEAEASPLPDNAEPTSQLSLSEVPASQNPSPKMASVLGTAKKHWPTIVGGLGGAGLMLSEVVKAHKDQTNNADIRASIKELQNRENTFGNSINIARKQLSLSVQEMAKQHPVGVGVAATLAGASAGAGLGRAIQGIVRQAKEIKSL
jgi:bacterioferritin (cytochrome b1)